jgi:hypothetical protein
MTAIDKAMGRNPSFFIFVGGVFILNKVKVC